MARKRARQPEQDVAARNFQAGLDALAAHPMFLPLLEHAHIHRHEWGNRCPADGWAVVDPRGRVDIHQTRRGEPEEWVWVLAHCLLHLGFGHIRPMEHPREWNAACDMVVAGFLAELRVGTPPSDLRSALDDLNARSEERLYARLTEDGIPRDLRSIGTAGPGAQDKILETADRSHYWTDPGFDWQACFGRGLAEAVTSAVGVAAGRESRLGAATGRKTAAERARAWFIASYPLLGSLAATFTLVEDAAVCARMSISVAAVDFETREIFMNPAAGMDEHECRFVMAHELLHVGLRHDARRLGRDPYLWNVACDYVINGWLLEMGVGELPRLGVLHDRVLRGESAEGVYDRIVTDMRRYRKLATLRGVGLSDMLEPRVPDWWTSGSGADLDAFYRRCLSQGLTYHTDGERGLLPAGLVEEIRALEQPPIPWDVELAEWFEEHFPPLEMRRSYARPSRRQSATPDIPRPRWVPAEGAEDGRTFGVVLDTSGSMDRALLAKALGAIASYSIAHDVPAARVVFCDAATYDQGYMPPEDIAGKVRVRGRGGTVLQPGIDLLERAEDFPDDGPLLIITDGYCDRLRVRREHAFLLPQGRSLPFVPKGRVFRIR